MSIDLNVRQSSHAAFVKAKKVMPGGVNSPVRAFGAVGGEPVFFSEGCGAWLTDIDGNRYLDFLGSWGPLILGHAYPRVVESITRAAQKGTGFGAPGEKETKLAELIRDMVPSIDMVRLVNSGTEATMSAIRLARAATRRDLIVKFEGCYHGHGDSFLIAAGSGAATLGIPNSPGVPRGIAQNTLVARFNDPESVSLLFEQYFDKIAAVIVEPVAGNMGVIAPREGFLEYLRDVTTRNGSLLIFDEVMTGFRLAPGGAQQRYGVIPDLTTLGKIVGGGMSIGAYGGIRSLMELIAPQGPVYQAGTLSGNPIAVAAGFATLTVLRNSPGIYDDLETKARRFAAAIQKDCDDAGVPAVVSQIGSMMTLFFTSNKFIFSYDDVRRCDTQMHARYFHHMLDQGVYLPPSQYESWFLSDAHTDEHIDLAISKNRRALKSIQE